MKILQALASWVACNSPDIHNQLVLAVLSNEEVKNRGFHGSKYPNLSREVTDIAATVPAHHLQHVVFEKKQSAAPPITT